MHSLVSVFLLSWMTCFQYAGDHWIGFTCAIDFGSEMARKKNAYRTCNEVEPASKGDSCKHVALYTFSRLVSFNLEIIGNFRSSLYRWWPNEWIEPNLIKQTIYDCSFSARPGPGGGGSSSTSSNDVVNVCIVLIPEKDYWILLAPTQAHTFSRPAGPRTTLPACWLSACRAPGAPGMPSCS